VKRNLLRKGIVIIVVIIVIIAIIIIIIIIAIIIDRFVNPVFDENFPIIVHDPDKDILEIRVMSGRKNLLQDEFFLGRYCHHHCHHHHHHHYYYYH